MMVKIIRLIFTLLIAVVACSFCVLQVGTLSGGPVYAGITSWVEETIPGTAGKMIAPGTDVSDFATKDYSTIYATDRESDKIYRSTDAGFSWIELTNPTGAAEPQLIAVAPDNPNIVAIVADGKEVYASTDNGTTWDNLGTPGGATSLYDIDIAPILAGFRYVAVAGTEAGPLADVWYCNIDAPTPVWSGTSNMPGFRSTTSDRAAAVAFSSNFQADQVMLVVTEEDDGAGGADNVSLEVFSFNTSVWNSLVDVSFPRLIVSNANITGITGIDSASICLDQNFYIGDSASQIGFVGLTVAGDADAVATSGIYRILASTTVALKTGVKIHSVAWDGTNLVAGEYDTTTVWRSSNALSPFPTFLSSLKRPGGENKVVVAWAGSNFVAGTSGDESAFALSRSTGASFNDISLIDTELTTLEDVAVSVDGSKVYLATDDGADLSLWRRASSWERVLGVQNDKGFIVRLAPDDSNAVYVAQTGGSTIYYTTTGGDTKWENRASLHDIQDMAVEKQQVCYVAHSGNTTVSRSIDGCLSWYPAEDTGLVSGNISTISIIGVGNLITGSDQGYVAYSTDNASSWTGISQQIETGALLTQVTASGLANGDYIYATSSKADAKVLRWQIGISTDWEDMTAPVATAYGAYGIVLQDGVLYIADSDAAANSELLRTPDPTASTVVWSTRASTGGTFIRTPSALRVSAGSAKLWVIDTTGNKLFSYTEVPPVITTNDVTAMTVNSARLNGDLDDLGTALSVSLSFEWGWTKGGPYPNETAAETANATGAFSSDITGLVQNTTYYFRARAVGDGTSHGNEKSFSILAPQPEPGYYLRMNLLGTWHGVTTNYEGRLDSTLEATSTDGTLTVTVPGGTRVRQENGTRLTDFKVTVNEDPPPPPGNKNIIGLTYNFEPDGAIFDPSLTLTFTYDPANIPEGVAEEDLVLAFYNENTGEWVELECTVDTENNIITASVSHFTDFAVVAPVPPSSPPEPTPSPPEPAPAAFSLSNLTVQPAEVEPGETITVSMVITNNGGETGSYTAVLKINGVGEAEKRVTVSAGGSEVVSFSVSRQDAGSYSVAVDGLEGLFTVKAPETVPAPPEPTEGPAAPPEAPPETGPPPAIEQEEGVSWYIIGTVLGVVLLLVILILIWIWRRRAGRVIR